jgi:hypothetical protein
VSVHFRCSPKPDMNLKIHFRRYVPITDVSRCKKIPLSKVNLFDQAPEPRGRQSGSYSAVDC